VLFFFDWGGWGIPSANWAVIMIAVAAMLGLLMQWRENDSLYVLVLVWAFVGIAISQADTVLVTNTAWVASGLLGLSVIGAPFLQKRTELKV
jgi:hypothetical protein